MTRTGTLALARCAALAMFVGWTGPTLAQTSNWQPSRSADAPPRVTSPPRGTASPHRWIAPTQTANSPKAAKSSRKNLAGKPTARQPKPFVAPADAELIAPTKPANETLARNPVGKLPSQNPAAKRQPQTRANTNVSAARVSTSAARPVRTPAKDSAAVAQRPQPVRPQQTHSEPRRRPATGNRLWDDSWIRPLRQVAYQDGQPEELYAPPGHEMETPMEGEIAGPEFSSDGEWIDPADGMPYGDGECGPDGACGPMCGDGVCEPSCGCGSRDCDGDSCSIDLACGLDDPEACQEVRFRVPRPYALMVGGGVHGFKGPFDQDRDSGNFGFQEGFNVGFKVPFSNVGYQFGYQATQSQLSGDADTGIVNGYPQHFLTAGVFRRSRDGFQGGIAWDWLLDERNTSVIDFHQLRAELGFVDCGCHEVGAMMAVHLTDHTLVNQQQESIDTFQPTDQYLLYYRMHGQRGGEGRVYGGVTDDSDGIVGADFLLPLTKCWSLQPSFTYLIPDENGGSIGARQEAWNIGINLVWHWKGQARSCHQSPYRPLFNVADNGTMIIDDRP